MSWFQAASRFALAAVLIVVSVFTQGPKTTIAELRNGELWK